MRPGGPRALVAVAGVSMAVALGPARAEAGPVDERLLVEPVPRRALVALPAGAEADLESARARSCAGGLCTVDLLEAGAALRELVARGATRLEASGLRRPLLERSLPAAGLPEDRARLGADGAGVVVAIVDTGIDFRHPDFVDDEGRSRILYLVDLSLEPEGLHPELESAIGGAVWDHDDLSAHLEAEARGEEPARPVGLRDTSGHGTHVASVAAGRRGVAPGAWIVAVRASRRDWPVVFEDADVLEAARLVFELAEREGLPCVLVLALGGHQGGHDGRSLLELGLAELVSGPGGDRPGRAVVVAAGNGGGCREHASGELRPGETVEVLLEVRAEDPDLAVDLELWLPAGSEARVGLEDPGGGRLEPVARGERRSRSGGSALVSVANAPDGPDPLSGDLRALVSLRAQLEGPVEPGRYRLLLEGSGRFDAYLSWSSSSTSPVEPVLASHLGPDGTLTVPATAEALISVGATSSRTAWLDEAGRPWSDDRFATGELALYSGSGPTRTGGLAPTLVAPGHVVVAALGAAAEPPSPTSVFSAGPFTPDRYRVVGPGDRAVLWGTSVAAPHVAGAVALLLELDPALDQRGARALLVASARTDGGARGRAWSPRWGFGSLEVEGALRLAREGFGGPPSPASSSFGVSDDVVQPGGCLRLTAVPRDRQGRPSGPGRPVRVLSSAGAAPPLADLGDGVYEGRWCADGLRPGAVVELEARSDGVALGAAARVLVARDRRHAGGWFGAAGGCRAGGGGGAAPGPAAAIRLLAGGLGPPAPGRRSPGAPPESPRGRSGPKL